MTFRDLTLTEVCGHIGNPVKHKLLGVCEVIGVRTESDSSTQVMLFVKKAGHGRLWVYDYETETWPPKN
jgi:hypothetical protein